MLLEQTPLAANLLDAHSSARHVNETGFGIAHAVEGADQVGALFFRASHQGVEPARRHQQVVVEEHDISAGRLGETDVSGLVGAEKPVSPNELEGAGLRLLFQISGDFWRGSAVDIDEAKGQRSVLEDGFE